MVWPGGPLELEELGAQQPPISETLLASTSHHHSPAPRDARQLPVKQSEYEVSHPCDLDHKDESLKQLINVIHHRIP